MVLDQLVCDVGVDSFGVAEFTYPCILHGFDGKCVATAFGGFVELVIMPQWFVDDLGVVFDNLSSVIQDSWVDNGSCEWGNSVL